ncbi:hypothetical protein, partial [Methanobrevibacter sp.]|uniref:hypothetical protein n=1 Tax=Methanobrevibacter sp. TaxID=66852 RepID=UPI00388E3EAF
MFISLIMLSIVMLSVTAAFAADDTADITAIDDEISVDEEVLAVEEDTQVLSEDEGASTSSIIINNSNIREYISEAGQINKNITADELIFEGTFENLTLFVESPFKITGYNSNLINPDIQIYSSNVTFSGFTINQTTGINSIFAGAVEGETISDVVLTDLTIDFVDANSGPEGIPIHVLRTENFCLSNSVINYVGNTMGYYVNNAILISSSNNAIINGNKFKISIPSAAVGWAEVPAGSGNWVSSPMSEGIVVDSSDDVIFDSNEVNVVYNAVVGEYDTIYSIDFKNSNKAVISNNVIDSTGFTYIYGIILSGDDFIIRSNNITSVGDYYANGIDVEGPASGVVEDNVIDVKANTSVYGIYSGMNGADVKANYTGNTITGEAYNVFGFSSGDVESNIVKNEIELTGNYTTGIAFRGSSINIDNNHIVSIASEEGNETIWEGFGVEAVGVKVIMGNATINNNTIAT